MLPTTEKLTKEEPIKTGRLFAVLLKLHPEKEGWVWANEGQHAHAAFLDLIRHINPEISARLHQSDQRRPYTVSSLRGASVAWSNGKLLPPGKSDEGTGKVTVYPAQSYWLRFTILDETIFNPLVRNFLTIPQDTGIYSLRLGGQTFRTGGLLMTVPHNPWLGHTSFQELHDKATSGGDIGFEFNSPTAFSDGQQSWGKRIVLLPEPARVFKYLATTWNKFAPAPLAVDSAVVQTFAAERVVIAEYTLQTAFQRFDQHGEKGFLGEVMYRIKGRPGACSLVIPDRPGPDLHESRIAGEAGRAVVVDQEKMTRTLNMLADFALYAGIGHKCGMGMGQVRRV